MGLNFTMVMCVVAIVICSMALVLNLVAGHYIWVLVMVFCIVMNTVNLVNVYNRSREHKRY